MELKIDTQKQVYIPKGVDKYGRIYIPKGGQLLFPKRGIIFIDGCEASVNTTTRGDSYIYGLKGYVKIGEPLRIVCNGKNDYSLSEAERTSVVKQEREEKPIRTSPIKLNAGINPRSTEDWAVMIFEEYLFKYRDRFRAIEENGKVIGDIRKYRDGYKGVYADYVVYDTIREEEVFFEIKGTSKTDQYWGGVTFKELESAVQKGENYFFAIVCTDGRRRDPFIHHKREDSENPYDVFMSLKEFLAFTTRASLGIQFTIKYSSDNSRLEATQDGKNAYSEDELKKLLDSYAELKEANLAR